jgi:beta-glucosidase
MISPKSLSLTALLLGATANAQVYETGGRSEDAFSWIQPEDTIVLDQYNSSEPVYPSREYDKIPTDRPWCTNQILARISNATNWKDGLEKARAFVAELTLQEKADMGMLHPMITSISTGANSAQSLASLALV